MQRIIRTVLVITLPLALLVLAANARISVTTPKTKTAEPKVDTNDLSFYRPPTKTEPYPLASTRIIRNVIFCIGDGMGLSQVALARARAAGLGGKLTIERLPVTGLVRTHSADSCVTDSAAAGTALACGVKTNNGMIGVTPDERGYGSILEAAQSRGMTTGVVVTSTVTHATPASFTAHVKSRKTEDKIAEQLLADRVNVIFGGGRRFFLPQSEWDSARKDDVNLMASARQAGYLCIETAEELHAARGPYLLGLFQLDALKTAGPEPSLAVLTEKAIQVLKSVNRESLEKKSGFFLMVEGSQIDWACHANDAKAAVRQVLLFDQAVEAAVEFALTDGHTLVIVTADHETGGLTLAGGGNEDKGDADFVVHWSTKGHTGTPVPIYALGPSASQFAGVCDNTDIPKRIARLLGLRPFPRPVK